ncbi:class I SAM-dependent methyltransferase [Paucihalobacter sp.]|uniref:class I SAM-dependent methyltransferase n=1 Tax=Paucihalobacter sp. TaxID=2850405 RepID=UPI003D1622CD
MNSRILSKEIQGFIEAHLQSNTSELALKQSEFFDVSIAEIIEQIESKKRCEHKLPSWFHTSNIYYPNKLNIEQTSSELTANYKANLVVGKTIVDITGGFGVDAFAFAKHFDTVIHCELNESLHEIASHNFEVLKIKNIKTLCGDGMELLATLDQKFDCIYIDPSRRNEHKGKVFMLSDCLPNVPEYLETLFNYSKNILIKTAPLLDISMGLSELTFVKRLYIVAVNNEVKELLWHLEFSWQRPLKIETINIKSYTTETFSFILEDEQYIDVSLSEPLTYLYEPNAAIMKSGAFKTIAKAFNVKKLHQHSHLYTSNDLIDFPGRVFQVSQSLGFSKKNLRSLNITKANIATRNFPMSVQALRTNFRLLDGGEVYIFFTTINSNQKWIIVCEKVS